MPASSGEEGERERFLEEGRGLSGRGRASGSMATAAARGGARGVVKRLADVIPQSVLQDMKVLSKRKQKGVSLKYMMDFGQNPVSRQLLLSAQFLHEELPTRLAHRVMELEGLPFGLSFKPQVLKVRPRETWLRPTSSVDRREADDGP